MPDIGEIDIVEWRDSPPTRNVLFELRAERDILVKKLIRACSTADIQEIRAISGEIKGISRALTIMYNVVGEKEDDEGASDSDKAED